MKKNNFASIESIIQVAKRGGMFILVDDEKRENEGDLIISTSDSNAKNINFMAKYGRGLICLALDNVQAKKLNLSLMSPINQSRNKTAFTVSIEAKKGITTGISAKDRAKTIKIASKKNVKKNEIVSPGHVFPIIAKDGGVLVRAGHQTRHFEERFIDIGIPYKVIGAKFYERLEIRDALAYIRVDQQLKDAFTYSGFGMGGTYIGKVPGLRIDYIWHDKELSSTNFITHKEKLSDHKAISADIFIP